MLAFEDYANAVTKSVSVSEHLEREISGFMAETQELSASQQVEQAELNRLRRSTRDQADVAALSDDIDALRAALTQVNIKTGSEEINAPALRGWRATLETRIAEGDRRIARLQSLAREVAILPSLVNEAAESQASIEECQGQRDTAAQGRARIGQEHEVARERVAQLEAQLKQVQADIEAITWVRAQKPDYVGLLETEEAQASALKEAEDALTAARARRAATTADLDRRLELLAAANERFTTTDQRLAGFVELQNSLRSWEFASSRLAEIIRGERDKGKALIALRSVEPNLNASFERSMAEQARLARVIEDADRSQSEIKQLLSQLQRHVVDGTCPLCGEDHGTQANLIRRIRQKIAADGATGARRELSTLRTQGEEISRQLETNRRDQRLALDQTGQLSEERGRLDTEIGGFRRRAASLGLNIEQQLEPIARQIQANILNLRSQVDQYQREVQIASNAAAAGEAAAEELRLANSQLTTQHRSAQTALEQTRAQLESIRDDRRSSIVPVDAQDEQIDGALRALNSSLEGARGAHAAAHREVARLQQELDLLARQIARVEGELRAARARLNGTQQARAATLARLAEARLPEDSDERELLNQLTIETRSQAHLRALQETASNLEIGLDAATTAAALAGLRKNVENREAALADLRAKRDAYLPWKAYFAEIQKLVSSEQNSAIDNFTRQYGPRTSVIQQRLRSVYGFDDIEIESRGSEIVVSAKRRGEHFRPTDYFSQSQQQTLLLGLFLTACSGQNWSTFAPIFLDDPVTHFDDLNTYALLDLIVGLLNSDLGNRQFIISSCDEKLLQLARQKFSYLQDGVRFYRFKAFGEDGPVVERIAG
jgi:DNA repair protein SbcC/Rad50